MGIILDDSKINRDRVEDSRQVLESRSVSEKTTIPQKYRYLYGLVDIVEVVWLTVVARSKGGLKTGVARF